MRFVNVSVASKKRTLSGLFKNFSFSSIRVIFLSVFLLGESSYGIAQDIINPIKGSVLRKTLLDTVRIKAEQELQIKILFKVDELRTDGHWAFLSAVPVTQSAAEIDYSKTKFAEQFAQGMFDNVLLALLLKTEGSEEKWEIIEFSIGSTDAAFVDWPEKYGVPKPIVIAE